MMWRRFFWAAAALLAGHGCGALQFVTTADGHKLWYKWSRQPESAAGLAPLVVLHGGPQVPSDYLFDMERVSGGDRAVLFFDQLGCGRSDKPGAGDAYSVDLAVRDLGTVLEALDVDRYHLYGQSWGGLLAFLKASSADGPPPLSLTLSNTPSSVPLVEAEAGALAEKCKDASAFMDRHNYRGESPSPLLAAAYDHAGSSWRGTAAIAGLEASAEAMARVPCPTLVLRGEHDFVTARCVEAWRGIGDVTFEELQGCSHHALLEDPGQAKPNQVEFGLGSSP